MAEKETARNGIGKGTPGPGRTKGTPNKVTSMLRDAILQAAEETGEDGEGKDGLKGYLRQVARSDAKAFTSLLGRVLPLQGAIRHDIGDPLADLLARIASDGKRLVPDDPY